MDSRGDSTSEGGEQRAAVREGELGQGGGQGELGQGGQGELGQGEKGQGGGQGEVERQGEQGELREQARAPLTAPPRGLVLRLALALLWLYQRTLSPFLAALAGPGSGCRFYPSCSAYATLALQRHGVRRGLWLTARRLSRCRPGHPGGVDYP